MSVVLVARDDGAALLALVAIFVLLREVVVQRWFRPEYRITTSVVARQPLAVLRGDMPLATILCRQRFVADQTLYSAVMFGLYVDSVGYQRVCWEGEREQKRERETNFRSRGKGNSIVHVWHVRSEPATDAVSTVPATDSAVGCELDGLLRLVLCLR